MKKTKYVRLDELHDCIQLIGFRTSTTDYKRIGSIHGVTEEDIKDLTVFDDLVHQKHGHWGERHTNEYGFIGYDCSYCHVMTSMLTRYKYCPNCGALMDEGNAD